MDRPPSVLWSMCPYTREDIGDLFRAYGHVRHVRVITDRDTGRSRGFAFVTMPGRPRAIAPSRR